MAVMLNVDMYTDTPCKIIGAIWVALRLFCHLRYLNHHHHHFHHHLYHPQGLTVQAGTMKQGILPRNHLPVKAVIGVMGAAVRHISWGQSVMIEVLGVYEIWALCQSPQKLLWLQSNMWTFPCNLHTIVNNLFFYIPISSERLSKLDTIWNQNEIRNSHHICECHVANKQVGARP